MQIPFRRSLLFVPFFELRAASGENRIGEKGKNIAESSLKIPKMPFPDPLNNPSAYQKIEENVGVVKGRCQSFYMEVVILDGGGGKAKPSRAEAGCLIFYGSAYKKGSTAAAV